MAKGETYEEFVAKFQKDKPKTTDDCYTPQPIFEAVEKWVRNRYMIPDSIRTIRPFYPGGDFEKEDYTDGVVIDNPPFSILKKIHKFYQEHGVRFFLFQPFNILPGVPGVCFVAVGCSVEYENGARVNTSFSTNLEPECSLFTAPGLLKELKKITDKPHKRRPHMMEAISAADSAVLSRAGISYRLENKTKKTKIHECTVYGGCLHMTPEEQAEYIRLRKEANLWTPQQSQP